MNNELEIIVKQSGLELSKAQILLSNFQNYFEIASEWEQKAKMLIVSDKSQKAEMKMAREGRLFLKEKRVSVEKTRKELKEQSLREGQTIDAIAKILKNLIEPIEQHLEQQEKFIEIQEAKMKAERKENRVKILNNLNYDFSFVDILNMPDDKFDELVLKIENEIYIKLENEKKAELERLAKIEAERIENERIRIENAKLKEQQEIERIKQEKILAQQKAEFEEKMRLEKIEREKIEFELQQKRLKEIQEQQQKEKELKEQQEIERIKQENILAQQKADFEEKMRIEKIEREKIEFELHQKRLKELKEQQQKEKELKEQQEIERIKAVAPDKDKLIIFANELELYHIPEMNTENCQKIIMKCKNDLVNIVKYLHLEINKL